VPTGVLSKEQKAELISRVTEAILRIEGAESEPAQRARVYCLVNEIADGGWGWAGQVYGSKPA
jgi:phenylpyruvate tautomerase PptA (4-oxalocrotonate tautomerase family)